MVMPRTVDTIHRRWGKKTGFVFGVADDGVADTTLVERGHQRLKRLLERLAGWRQGVV